MQKLWRLEALRGAAALYVAIGHTFRGATPLLAFGQEAVMVFFLISGFVIEYSFSRAPEQSFSTYLRRRVLRIYPILLCMFAVAALLARAPVATAGFWKTLVANLLMLQDTGEVKPNVIAPALFSGALWSLHYEWWFYMLFYPLRRYLTRARAPHIVGGMGVLAALAYTFLNDPLSRLLLYFPIWWTGVEFARAYRLEGKVPLRAATTAAYTVAIAGVLLVYTVIVVQRGQRFLPGIHPFLEARHCGAAVAAVAVALCWQRARWIGFRRIVGWGCFFAPCSYALYIAHQPLLVDANYFAALPPAARYTVYVAVLAAFCWFTEMQLYPRLRGKSSFQSPT